VVAPHDPHQRDRAAAFVGDHEQHSSRSLLSDEVRSQWQRGRAHWWVASAASADHVPEGDIVGVIVAAHAGDTWLVESVAGTADVHHRLMTTVVQAADNHHVDVIRWWQYGTLGNPQSVAAMLGFTAERTLLQMRRPLPIADDAPDVAVRPFRRGDDDEAWVATNRLAFAWHPEQGRWTVDDLHARIAEPWFESDGFLVMDSPLVGGALAGFCWTKRHVDTDPMLGEIYVVAVHPSLTGRRLGHALTAAGLRSLHDRGAQIGMLHVDEGNTAAVRLYERMGFVTHHADRSLLLDITRPGGTS
jgi:mycothiol synthase